MLDIICKNTESCPKCKPGKICSNAGSNADGIHSKSMFSAGMEAMFPSGCHARTVKRWGGTFLVYVQSCGAGQAVEGGTL